MKNSPPSLLEQQCPECAGLFSISSTSRKKRVQCPRCRAVVTLAEPPAAAPAAEPVAESAPEWAARCDQLQMRIEALEQQVEALAVAPRRHASLLRDSSPMSHAQILGGAEEARPLFRPVLRAGEALWEIALLVATGGGEGRAVAEKLSGILREAGWKVRAVRESDGKPSGRAGLILAAGPALPTARITGTMRALREAGFGMSFQLDPDRGEGDAVLLVGEGAGQEKDAAVKE